MQKKSNPWIFGDVLSLKYLECREVRQNLLEALCPVVSRARARKRERSRKNCRFRSRHVYEHEHVGEQEVLPPFPRASSIYKVLHFFCVTVVLLFYSFSSLAQSVSSRPSRFGLSDSKIRELATWENATTTSHYTTPYKNIISLLRDSKVVFKERLLQTQTDFNKTGGYHYCAKGFSALGLLARLGDQESASIGREVLGSLVASFKAPLPTLSQLQRAINDRSLPYATRIRAYNRLLESGLPTAVPSRGDPIFLEVGAMSLCIGIGYDLLLPFLTSEERSEIELMSQELLLWSNNIQSSFFSTTSPSAQRESNWSAIMNGGSGVLALALARDTRGFSCTNILLEPRTPVSRRSLDVGESAKERICHSIVGLRHFAKAFTNAGGYPEGPNYWFYGMQPFLLFLNSLRESFGRIDLDQYFFTLLAPSSEVQASLLYSLDDFWSAKRAGLARIGVFPFSDTTPTLTPASFPFILTGSYVQDKKSSEYGWRLLNQQIINETIYDKVFWAKHSADWSRLFSLFEVPVIPSDSGTFNRLSSFSTQEHSFDIAVLRARGNGAVWEVHQKGGSVLQPHAHLDSGSFTLRIGTNSWFTDLGYEYNLSGGGYPIGYFNVPSEPSYVQGLRFFRKNDLSHNLVGIVGRTLAPNGFAKLISTRESSNPSDNAPLVGTTWDTSNLYVPFSSSSSRTFDLIDRGRYTSLDINDTFLLSQLPPSAASSEIAVWRAITCGVPYNQISIQPDKSVLLEKSATERIRVSARSPSSKTPRILVADPNQQSSLKKTKVGEIENSNQGCSLIEIPATLDDLTRIGERYKLNFSVRVSTPFE